MAAITNLDVLLRSMQPVFRPGQYVFVDGDGIPEGSGVAIEASVREAEGHSAVIARADADRLGLHYDFVASWITLSVVSALDAVGLTAAVSSELTEHGISCNVIAGLRHDHILVPTDRADDALVSLRRLTTRTGRARRSA